MLFLFVCAKVQIGGSELPFPSTSGTAEEDGISNEDGDDDEDDPRWQHCHSVAPSKASSQLSHKVRK